MRLVAGQTLWVLPHLETYRIYNVKFEPYLCKTNQATLRPDYGWPFVFMTWLLATFIVLTFLGTPALLQLDLIQHPLRELSLVVTKTLQPLQARVAGS